MNCTEARDLIAKGDLPGAHLASCAQCRGYSDEMFRLGKALSGIVVEAPAMALTLPSRRLRKPALLIAAVLLVLLVSAFGAKYFADRADIEEPNPPSKKMRIMEGQRQAGDPVTPNTRPR